MNLYASNCASVRDLSSKHVHNTTFNFTVTPGKSSFVVMEKRGRDIGNIIGYQSLKNCDLFRCNRSNNATSRRIKSKCDFFIARGCVAKDGQDIVSDGKIFDLSDRLVP